MDTLRTARHGLALLVAGLLTACSSYSVDEVRQMSVPHEMNTPLAVTSTNGSISVERANVDMVDITATIRSHSYSRLDETEVVAERLSDGTLEVYVLWPNDRQRGDEGASFVIKLPDAEGVYLRSSNGRLLSEGLAGEARLITTNGRITVEEHRGPVEAKTTNGRIEIDEVSGPVVARSTNGSIEVSLEEGAIGPITAKTTNGSITLEPGQLLSGELILSTTNGSLNFDNMPYAQLKSLSKNRVHLAFDDSDALSVAETTNGKISIK